MIPHVSDHLPNFIIIEQINTDRRHDKKYARDYKDFDINLFTKDLINIDLCNKLNSMNDVDTMYNFFHDILTVLLEIHVANTVDPRYNEHGF